MGVANLIGCGPFVCRVVLVVSFNVSTTRNPDFLSSGNFFCNTSKNCYFEINSDRNTRKTFDEV